MKDFTMSVLDARRPQVPVHYIDPDAPIELTTACGKDLFAVEWTTDWIPRVTCDFCIGSMAYKEATGES